MKSHCMRLLALMFFITLCFTTKAQIISTFDADADGWTFFDSSTPITVNHNSTNGNPGGFVSVTYASSISTTTESWFAPAKFLGNLLARSYGQNLKFDLHQSIAGTGSNSGIAEIRIERGSDVLIYQLPSKPAVAPSWTSYSIKLDETGGWLWSSTSGSPATRSQIISVLTNVTSIEIRGTYGTNASYSSGLDNVILEQVTLTPAPSATSLSATTGKPGDLITINGSGFSNIVSENIVSFGPYAGIKAIVQTATNTQLTIVVPEGAVYGPISITNTSTGLSGKSLTHFNPVFEGGGRIIPASFKNRFIISTIPIEGWFVGDFDGDGWEDFAVTNNNTEDVIDIYRNLGLGGELSAASFAPKVTIPAPPLGGSGTNGAGLWFVDLDGDGKLDAITSNALSAFSAAFVTLRNTSVPGNISFEAPEYWTGGSDETPPYFVGDIDGDGRPDLVGGEGSSGAGTNLWIAQNISIPGNIEFGPSVGYFSATVDGLSGVTMGDLNGDGKPDMIASWFFGDRFSIIQNNSTPGTISMTDVGQILTGQYNRSMRIVDINLDGKNDLVWKKTGGGVYIRLNADADGVLADSDFTTEYVLSSDLGANGGINIVDFNGDGKPDIASTDDNDVGVYESVFSGGTFSTNSFIPAYQVLGTGGNSGGPAISDLNHDGRPDFVMAGASSITIVENKNVVGPQIAVNTVSPLAAPVGATVTITGNNFSTVSTDNEVYFGAVRAIVITATETELTVIVPAGATYAPVSVRRGELTSRYRLPFRTTFSAGVTFDNTNFAPPVNFTLANANYDIEVGDLNRDGLPDILAEANGGFAFRNNHFTGAINTGSLIPDDTLSVNSFINPRIEDFDGDGFLDVASVNGLAHRNISTSAEISFEPSITTGLGASNMDMADFNNDGKIDFAVTDDLSGILDLVIRENRSTAGSFTTGTYGTFSANFSYNKPAANGGIVTEDFDGDGFADVATTNPLTDNISVYLNAGLLKVSNAQFPSRVDFAVGDNPGRIYKGDFDADGKVDLMLYHTTGTSTTLLTVFHNTSTVGNLSFTRIDLTNPSATTVATIADLDGDGKPEIITTSETGNRFSIFKNIHTSGALSAASFAAPFNTTVTAPRGIATGDLNLDGKPEIILTRAAGLLVVYENLIANPTILSFTPSSGQAGTEVTISGTNFSTVAFENDVRFNNNVRAWVKSSNATTLTVIVPPNATTGPIKVTVGINAPATSASDFTVIPFSCPPDPRTSGELDLSFNPLVQDPVTFTAVELQSTGKSIVAAPFVTINGASYEGILRFNSDGAIDNTFATSDTYFPDKRQMVVMPDDKILVADIGTESYIRRLNADGSLDNSFNSPSYYASTIHAISYQQDGKVLFSIYDDQQGDNFIYRLNTNGTLDNSFTSIAGLQANAIIQLSDGKILLGGGLRGGVTRLNASGTNDNSFAILDDMDGTVTDLALQSDNKIIAIGSFFSFDGVPVNNIVRLEPNGAVDFTFKSGQAFPFFAGLQLNTVKVLPNDKILIVGEFLTYNYITRNRIILLNNDGSVDCTFDALAGPDSMITDAAIQLDGKILITGSFTNYEAIARNAFARVTNSIVSIVPTITSFTPAAAKAGSTITITGLNFAATPAQNTVFIGGAKAQVVSASTTSLQVVVPVAATSEQITVTVNGLTGYSTNRFVITHDNGTINYNTKNCFPVNGSPRELTTADLNNDGHLDLIVTNVDTGFGTLLFGKGDGRFDPPVQVTTGSGGIIAVGDYSGDGTLDLAFSNYSASLAASASVLINNGSGGFPSTNNYSLSNPPVGVGSGAVYIADADFNLDGKVDLVAAIDNIPGSISVLINNGTSFEPKVEYPVTYYPYSVNAADLNNDRYPDLVVANFFTQTISVLINNKLGEFPVETTYPSGNGTHEVEMADLNKDGLLDLIAINATSNTVSVYINEGGVFSPKVDYASGAGYQTEVELADINGDGNLDLIASSSGNQIFIMQGNGTGGFGTPQSFSVGNVPYGITVGDFDEDGKPDVAVSNFNDGTVCVLLTSPTSTITITQQPVNPNNVCEGGNYVLSTDATGTTNITYKWQKYNTGTAAFEDLTDGTNYSGVNTKNLTITNAAMALAGDYRCMINGDNATVVYCNVGTLTVNSKPADPVVTNGERCGPGQVILSATGGAPGEFIWRTDPMVGEPIQNENDPTYTTPIISATTTYYVAVGNGLCESNMVPVIATIKSTPALPVVVNAGSCGPGTVKLQATGGTNGQYRWYDLPSGGTALAGEVNNSFTTPLLTVTTTYYVSINNGSCESARAPVIASVNTTPTKPTITASETINAGVVAICLQPITLSAPAGFTSYSWSTGQNTQQISTIQPGNYSVSVTDANGCSSVLSDVVQVINSTTCVNNAPVINTTSLQTFIGGKVTIDLSDLISDPDNNLDPATLQVINNATQKGGKTTLDGFILEIDYATAKFSGKDLVTIRVCDLLNVCFEAAFEIDVIGDIVVYNGISPNGDTKNDSWLIEYITLFPDTQQNKVSIYNRWGDLVWEGENYDNNNVVFTGLNKNGNELGTGTYFYKIVFVSGRETITGYLSLKR